MDTVERKVDVRQLRGGSLATTQRISLAREIVRKTCSFESYDLGFVALRDQYTWMKYHSERLPSLFPRIFGDGFLLDSGTPMYYYDMEYVEGVSGNEVVKRDPKRIVDLVEAAREIHAVKFTNGVSFDAYEKKIRDYCGRRTDCEWGRRVKQVKEVVVNGCAVPAFDPDAYLAILNKYRVVFTASTGNCHGDLTLENTVWPDAQWPVFIDSNYTFSSWGSPLLDFAKIHQSVHYGYEELFAAVSGGRVKCSLGEERLVVETSRLDTGGKRDVWEILSRESDFAKSRILEVSMWVRMLPYKLRIGPEHFMVAFAFTSLALRDLVVDGVV